MPAYSLRSSRRSSRRVNPPSAFDALSDDVVLRVFSRAPFMTHGTLHVVCRRLKTLLRSPEFLQQRVDSGLVEHGLVAAGGAAGGAPTAQCDMLSSGRWRPITPLNGTRAFACSAIMEDEDGQPEMWVMGGCDDSGDSGVVGERQLLVTCGWARRRRVRRALRARWWYRDAMGLEGQ